MSGFLFRLVMCLPSPRFFSSYYDELFKTGFEKVLASLGAYEIISMMDAMDPDVLFKSMSHINFNRIIHRNQMLEPAVREVLKASFSKVHLFYTQPGISVERYKDDFIHYARSIRKLKLDPKNAEKYFDCLENSLPWVQKDDRDTKDQILEIMLELSCKLDTNLKNIFQAWQTYAKMTVFRRQPLVKIIYAYMKKEIPENPSQITKPDPWLKLLDSIDNLLTDYDYAAKDQILFFRAKVFLTSDPRQSFEYALQIKSPSHLDAADNLLISDILYADSRSSLNIGIRNRAAAHLSQAAKSGDGMAKDRLKDRLQPVMPSQTYRTDEKLIEIFEDDKDDRDHGRCFVDSAPHGDGSQIDSDFSYQRLINLDEDETPSIGLSTGNPMPESKLHQSQLNTHLSEWESPLNSFNPFNFFSAEENELMLKVKILCQLIK